MLILLSTECKRCRVECWLCTPCAWFRLPLTPAGLDSNWASHSHYQWCPSKAHVDLYPTYTVKKKNQIIDKFLFYIIGACIWHTFTVILNLILNYQGILFQEELLTSSLKIFLLSFLMYALWTMSPSFSLSVIQPTSLTNSNSISIVSLAIFRYSWS